MYFYSFQEQERKEPLNELLDSMGLQKRLYFAQMFSLYYFKKSLFYEDFEAWDYGPVIPCLYQTKKYTPEVLNQEYIANKFEDFVIETTFYILHKTSSKILSDISHEENSAWKKFYQPGLKHIKIPKEDIINHPCHSLIRATEEFLKQEEERKKDIPNLLEGVDILEILK